MPAVAEKKVGFISARDLIGLLMIGLIGYSAYALLNGGSGVDPWGPFVLKSTLVGKVDMWQVPRIKSVQLEQLVNEPSTSVASYANPAPAPGLVITRASCVSVLYVRRDDKRSWVNSGPSASQKIGSSGGTFVNTVDVGKNPLGHRFYVYVLFVRTKKWNEVKDKSDPTTIIAGGDYYSTVITWEATE